MRQIFSSQRLENVEGVARLLEEHGIETYTSNRRAYRGKRRSGFSYASPDSTPESGVWVVRADDLVRARELLRQAGLLASTRDEQSYLSLPPSPHAPSPRRWAMRLRLALIAITTVLAVLSAMRMLGH